jgi:hypothetical protein
MAMTAQDVRAWHVIGVRDGHSDWVDTRRGDCCQKRCAARRARMEWINSFVKRMLHIFLELLKSVARMAVTGSDGLEATPTVAAALMGAAATIQDWMRLEQKCVERSGAFQEILQTWLCFVWVSPRRWKGPWTREEQCFVRRHTGSEYAALRYGQYVDDAVVLAAAGVSVWVHVFEHTTPMFALCKGERLDGVLSGNDSTAGAHEPPVPGQMEFVISSPSHHQVAIGRAQLTAESFGSVATKVAVLARLWVLGDPLDGLFLLKEHLEQGSSSGGDGCSCAVAPVAPMECSACVLREPVVWRIGLMSASPRQWL